ncbi:MAG TPA: BamA/TamA family outer membrane protein [Candidatus Krumholzibacteria bacterium]|nr:BamA/TamA family outer membrane protein [Candidatus Krumholzibacteria bacterium]HRX50580.1 BamA/TamA family outer membrane protein [Candidatus Krumholzibacteria bacterium]
MPTRRRIPAFALPSLLTALLLCAATAWAREGWEVRSVSVTGLPAGVADPADRLGLAARGGLLGGNAPVFREATLQADLQRLRLLLARHGYPYAAIRPSVRADERARRVSVTLAVKPGRPVRVADVRVDGVPDGLTEAGRAAASLLPRRAVFRDADAEAARRRLAADLAAAGYLHAEATLSVERPDSFTAVVALTAAPGERLRVVRTEVSGVTDDLVDLARRTMSVADSALATPALLDRARSNLRELSLFRQIRIDTEPAGPGAVALRARLAKSPYRTLRFSLGTWSDDPVRARAGWQHRNIFHHGRGLGFSGSYSLYHQEVSGRAWWPALVGARSVGEVSASWQRDDEDGYTLRNNLVETALLLRPLDRLSVRLGASLEDVTVRGTGADRDEFDSPAGRMLVFSARVHDDRTDDLLEPTRGVRLTLETAWSPPGALSVSPFGSVEGTAVGYAPLPAGAVLASRVALGLAGPLGDVETLLPNRRFFAGGATTMRGAKRRRLGPVDDDGDPIGGDAMLLASAEVRAPLWGLVSWAAFLDAGQVWADRRELTVDDLQSAAGLGLVFRTPVGPVRTDLARMLREPRAGEPRTVFHLSIGHPY